MRGHKLDHLNSITGKSGVTLALPATAVVEFMTKWLNLYLRKGLCTYYVRPLDGWVGYQGEYLSVHGGWVGPSN